MPRDKGGLFLRFGQSIDGVAGGGDVRLVQGSVHAGENGLVVFVVPEAQLHDVLDVFPRLHRVLYRVGPGGRGKLGDIHGHRQLAVRSQIDRLVLGAVFADGLLALEGELGFFRILPFPVNAAAEGDAAGIGRAVGLLEVEGGLGRPAKLQVIQGIELQAGGIPLAGNQVGLVHRAQIDRAVAPLRGLGAAVHVGGDAAFLIDGGTAVSLALHGLALPIAVGIGEGGGQLGVALEQVELVGQGFHAQVQSGVGLGEGMLHRNLGLTFGQAGKDKLVGGRVGAAVEILDVLIQAAPVIVHRGHAALFPPVCFGPLHPVAQGAPGVIPIVDGDHPLQVNIALHVQNLFLGDLKFVFLVQAADLGHIGHLQGGRRLLPVNPQLQGAVAVHIQ